MVVAVVAPAVVSAQNDSGNQSDETVTTQNTAEAESDRQARLEEAKKNQATKLTSAEERRVAGLCKASQTVITRLQAKVKTTAQARNTRYEAITTKLDTLVTRLQAASVDTTALEAAIAALKTKITAHTTTSLEGYQTALADLAEMDCATDPSGFKAVLTQTRTQRGTLVDQAKELKNMVTVEIRALLDDIKAQLEAAKAEAEE